MAMIDDNSKTQIKNVFGQMKETVNVVIVTKKEHCDTCDDTVNFVTEITDLSDKLTLEVINVTDEKAKTLNVEMAPAIVLLGADNKDYGIKFYGIPAGHEINSFIMGILEISGTGETLSDALMKRINGINKPVDIKVFVTLGCPHCPGAVAKAHKIALLNSNVNAEMIEANIFGEIAQKFNVSSVPKIVFNNGAELIGDQPIEAFLSTIETL